jgi:SAM-dependent methyltransferase
VTAIEDKTRWGNSLGIGVVNLAHLAERKELFGERILDVGCGFGFVVGNLKAQFKVGVDRYKSGREAAGRFQNVLFLGGDAKSLPLKDESLDTVFCLDVLEHVEEPSQAVKEVFRVLKAGGRAYFSTPVSGVNFIPGWSEYTSFLHRSWGHRRVYSREEFIALLEGGGFSDVRTDDYMHLTTRVFLYIYYAATSLSGSVDGRIARAAERLLYGAARVDEKIKFWSAFQTTASARKKIFSRAPAG